MTLADRTIVVTGAASGIGAETAALLKREGAYVIGVDRHRAGEADEWRQADLLDRDSINDLVEGLPSGLHGLANIAGLPPTAPPGDVIKVNLRGLQLLTNALVPKLADGASIVNLASSAGNRWADSLDQILEFESSRPATIWKKADEATSSPKKPWWCGPCRTDGPGSTAASG